jgi:hypothetical protein
MDSLCGNKRTDANTNRIQQGIMMRMGTAKLPDMIFTILINSSLLNDFIDR